jgi:hypothetical protein
MWRSLTTGFRSPGNASDGGNTAEPDIKPRDQFAQNEREFRDDNEALDDVPQTHYTEAQLLSSDVEKKYILSMFSVMRKDSFFCDVAFVCNGALFRAHRVVVSAWSRWLRALLCESPDEEVIPLDFFDATALGSVLDYMYGSPLSITVAVSYLHFFGNFLC